jgi:hypothetical protein
MRAGEAARLFGSSATHDMIEQFCNFDQWSEGNNATKSAMAFAAVRSRARTGKRIWVS